MIARRLKKEDLHQRVEWMNNPRVYSSMHYDVPVRMDKTICWFENNIGNENRVDLSFEENGEIVAFGGFTDINRKINKAELYVFVSPLVHNNGIGTRVTKSLCRYGFDKLGLNKIFLETNEDNRAAQRVYEKCGFVLEGKLRNECCTKGGRLMCRYYYGLLREELCE